MLKTPYWKVSKQTNGKIKDPRPLRAALDSDRFLITDKHTEILDCIPCVMVIFLSTRQAEPI